MRILKITLYKWVVYLLASEIPSYSLVCLCLVLSYACVRDAYESVGGYSDCYICCLQLAKGFDLNAMSESDRSAFNVDLHITSSDERKETLWNILSGPSDLAILLSSIASSMGYAE